MVIFILRTSLLEALQNGGNYIEFYDDEQKCRLVKKKESTEHLLYTTFYQIIHYGSKDISILLAILDTLTYIAENSEHHIKIEIKAFVEYVIGKFDEELLEELDRKQLLIKQNKFVTIVG